jgi:DNA polymerase-3 subunit chi
MTEIGFYHLTRSPLERALPRLLEKAFASGARIVVMAGSEERVDALDQVLWTYDPASFLPHGAARDGEAPEQPIWLTSEDENPNEAAILVLTDGATSDKVAEYARCLEMFDGNDEDAVTAARARWRDYDAAGHALTYWQQTERGGWEKKED